MFELQSVFGGDSGLFLALAAVGLAMAVIIDQGQLLAKYQGARSGKIAGGYNTAMKIMVMNRLGAVLYFFFIALSIDFGADAASISRFFMFAISAVALADVFVLVWFRKWRHVKGLLEIIRTVAMRPPLWPVLGAFWATFFGLLGLTLPMLMSAANPQFRLTLANTGFVFNSIFTVINVFFVENHVAKMIDKGDARLSSLVVLIYQARILSALSCVVLLYMVHRAL